MDIVAGIRTAIFLAVLGALVSVWIGLNQIRSARALSFYRLRQRKTTTGWRLLGTAFFLVILAVVLGRFGEPVIFTYYPPTPTISPTPTITLTPTPTEIPSITPSPTITNTPSVTDTPTPTLTPFIPPVIEALFESEVTPNPDAVFSPLQFSTKMEDYQAVSPSTYFVNPIDDMFAVFQYNNMFPGVQVTELWFLDGQMVHYNTFPWDGTTGGLGFAECNYTLCDGWQPGDYQLQIFVGNDWKVVGLFTLEGEPFIATPTFVPTLTPSVTVTPEVTETPEN